MRHLILSAVLSAGVAIPAIAETCPPAPDHAARLGELIGQIQQAETEMAAREISNQMWELWADAPDEAAQTVLDQGMSRRNWIRACPDVMPGICWGRCRISTV